MAIRLRQAITGFQICSHDWQFPLFKLLPRHASVLTSHATHPMVTLDVSAALRTRSPARVTPIRVALVTNTPTPYRVPVLNLLALNEAFDLRVFYSAFREADREWELPEFQHPHTVLRPHVISRNGKFIHNNLEIFAAFRAFRPDVAITTGFNPTHLYAFAYTELFRRPHIVMTDGTLATEVSLSKIHRLARNIVFGRSSAFVVASEGGRALLKSYGVAEDRIFLSPLCANKSVQWSGVTPCSPGLDFLYSSRLVEGKNPFFALQVAKGVAKSIGRRITLGVLGNGPLKSKLQEQADKASALVELRMPGHVTQAEIPAWLVSARVFLFPTSMDTWGVVANEACEAGLPVIITPQAGAARELIRDNVNGYVRELELPAWIDVASNLLLDQSLHRRMAEQARILVKPYSFQNAANGLAAAITKAVV